MCLCEKAGTTTVTARQDACADRERTCERRHRDHKTYCYVSYLLLDEGRRIGRPEQVGVAYCGNEEDGRVNGQEVVSLSRPRYFCLHFYKLTSDCKNGGRSRVGYARLDKRLEDEELSLIGLDLERAFRPLD